MMSFFYCTFFFFNDTATTEIYTLSLHDALPISRRKGPGFHAGGFQQARPFVGKEGRGLSADDGARPAKGGAAPPRDRKSTRLNSSHANISYAVFCLKKKKNIKT